jgi:hypothetical protein
VLSTVCFNNKKLISELVTPFKESFCGMIVQDNKLLPFEHKLELYIEPCMLETLIRKHKIKSGVYYGCRFTYFYGKYITRKHTVNQFLHFTHKAINSYLAHNKIDSKDHFIPPSLSEEYVGMLRLVPVLYCIWANDDFIIHNIMTFEVYYDKKGYDGQWPRITTPSFVFQSTNEELQKILSLEPIKQITEKMKQTLTSELFEQIQINISKLGEE